MDFSVYHLVLLVLKHNLDEIVCPKISNFFSLVRWLELRQSRIFYFVLELFLNKCSLVCESNVCCLICAGNHSTTECNNKNEHRCTNCIFANSKYNVGILTYNEANNLESCESYNYFLQRQIKNTTYPYNPLVRNGRAWDNFW